MRGFLLGVLALIVLQSLTDERRAERLGALGKTIGDGVRRALSPGVAGLRNFAGDPGAAAAAEPVTSVAGRPPRTGRQVARPGQPVAQ